MSIPDADLHPRTAGDVLSAVKWAAGEQVPLEIVGQGSKRAIGRPMQTAHTLDLSGLSGITLFEPDELVLSARAGTPLSDIVAELDAANQELQFEPADLGPVLGLEAGRGTLGGLVSTNFAGPRRLKSGSARDHILGINAVSGRGEMFKSGGRVVKNVTGYDLSKGLTGAWGTLAVLTDITMKVLPKSETENTLLIIGLSDAQAAEAMSAAMGSSAEVSGAAHLPNQSEPARTMLRVEGFAPSVAARMESLAALTKPFGAIDRLEAGPSRALWQQVRDCIPFATRQDRPLWRISCTPMQGHAVVSAITAKTDAAAFYDWQGGLIWLEIDGSDPLEPLVRQSLAGNGGGHATLIRATADQRQNTVTFQPQAKALAALSARYRANFDPHGILNPGRLGA